MTNLLNSKAFFAQLTTGLKNIALLLPQFSYAPRSLSVPFTTSITWARVGMAADYLIGQILVDGYSNKLKRQLEYTGSKSWLTQIKWSILVQHLHFCLYVLGDGRIWTLSGQDSIAKDNSSFLFLEGLYDLFRVHYQTKLKTYPVYQNTTTLRYEFRNPGNQIPYNNLKAQVLANADSEIIALMNEYEASPNKVAYMRDSVRVLSQLSVYKETFKMFQLPFADEILPDVPILGDCWFQTNVAGSIKQVLMVVSHGDDIHHQIGFSMAYCLNLSTTTGTTDLTLNLPSFTPGNEVVSYNNVLTYEWFAARGVYTYTFPTVEFITRASAFASACITGYPIDSSVPLEGYIPPGTTLPATGEPDSPSGVNPDGPLPADNSQTDSVNKEPELGVNSLAMADIQNTPLKVKDGEGFWIRKIKQTGAVVKAISPYVGPAATVTGNAALHAANKGVRAIKELLENPVQTVDFDVNAGPFGARIKTTVPDAVKDFFATPPMPEEPKESLWEKTKSMLSGKHKGKVKGKKSSKKRGK
jgi:hypothetical protein